MGPYQKVVLLKKEKRDSTNLNVAYKIHQQTVIQLQ